MDNLGIALLMMMMTMIALFSRNQNSFFRSDRFLQLVGQLQQAGIEKRNHRHWSVVNEIKSTLGNHKALNIYHAAIVVFHRKRVFVRRRSHCFCSPTNEPRCDDNPSVLLCPLRCFVDVFSYTGGSEIRSCEGLHQRRQTECDGGQNACPGFGRKGRDGRGGTILVQHRSHGGGMVCAVLFRFQIRESYDLKGNNGDRS